MNCPVCNKEWEGEGICPDCAEAQSTAVPESEIPSENEQNTPETDENTVENGENKTENTIDSVDNLSENGENGENELIPMPLLSEGFESGTDEKKKPAKRSTVRALAALLSVCVLALAFLAASYFVPQADVLHIFRPDYAAAEEVAISAFKAIYTDFDLNRYLELLPPRAVDSYVSSWSTNLQLEGRDALVEYFNNEQKKSYESFTFSKIDAEVTSVYTEKGIASFFANDYQSVFFGTDYTAEEIDELATLSVTVTFTAEGTESTEALSYTLACIDGNWYQIS